MPKNSSRSLPASCHHCGRSAATSAVTPPWCGRCTAPNRRLDEAGDRIDRPRRCPACHPLLAGASGR
jgi:hypothetical protein